MNFALPTMERRHRRKGATNRACFRVGGITVGVSSDDVQLGVSQDGAMSRFETEASFCDLELTVTWADDLAAGSTQPIFDSGGVWKLYHTDDMAMFDFASEPLGRSPYKRCWVDHTFCQGEIQMNRAFFSGQFAVNPLEYPLDELLFMHRLALTGGVEVHACGLVDENNRGHLFVGHSGAGKSTTASLWAERGGVTILSDDRIILRQEKGIVWMHGTPWHGDAGFAEAEMAQVSSIYLLEHGLENELHKLTPSQAGAELFARSFVPFHNWHMVDRTLGFLENLVKQVPCQKFRFTPDLDAVEFIVNAS